MTDNPAFRWMLLSKLSQNVQNFVMSPLNFGNSILGWEFRLRYCGQYDWFWRLISNDLYCFDSSAGAPVLIGVLLLVHSVSTLINFNLHDAEPVSLLSSVFSYTTDMVNTFHYGPDNSLANRLLLSASPLHQLGICLHPLSSIQFVSLSRFLK